jgi:hypothetical protein
MIWVCVPGRASSSQRSVWLVVYFFKAELVTVKIEGFVLIADAYCDGTDFRKHVSSIRSVDWQ